MKSRIAWLAAVLILVVAAIAFVGCSNDDNSTMLTNGSATVILASISPADGATGVSPATSVALKFTGAVDTMSVMQNLYLAGGQAMHEWRDSVSHHGGFGMMNMNMEQQMMNWMDSIHTPGEFHWNGTLDSCEFVPDSTLMPTTEYLCLLNEGGMQDGHGGMMGGANHNDNGYHMYGFTTAP